jgi:Nucleoside-diphosphate-sugar pyrophosphorylase involved in lipopolysaccharide biosynthesis/translation initiation factor 2B, gamma/epsilon subunits (eIF-2Bgamma/eIF-2Bepsilon)
MRPLTDHVPKPLLEAGGKPLIQYHIEAFAACGIRDIVINLAWKGALIRERLGDGARFGVRIAYSDEGAEALETGGGILQALPLLGPDPFIVVSGDIWTAYPFASLFDKLRGGDLAHFVFVPNPPFHPRGDFTLIDGRVRLDGAVRQTYANIGVLRPEFFEGCMAGRFPLAPIMRRWIEADRVSGELYEGPWRNVGTPEQLGELDRALRAT